MKPLELRDKAAALLDRLADRLPAEKLAQLREFNAVGEWGVLVDELVAGLVKRATPLRPAERDAVRELLYAFENPDPFHKFIVRRDEVLTQLTVTD